jgi:hypothetical protein
MKMNTHQRHRIWRLHGRTHARLLRNRLESGNVDGSLGDVVFVPFLLLVMLFGLMVALIGFWRVGASFSTQLSAQAGSVSPDQGNSILAGLWTAWTGGNAPTNGFSTDSSTRSVSSSINTTKSFDLSELGMYQFSISSGANMQIRSERFYPGQPVCTGTQCNE